MSRGGPGKLWVGGTSWLFYDFKTVPSINIHPPRWTCSHFVVLQCYNIKCCDYVSIHPHPAARSSCTKFSTASNSEQKLHQIWAKLHWTMKDLTQPLRHRCCFVVSNNVTWTLGLFSWRIQSPNQTLLRPLRSALEIQDGLLGFDHAKAQAIVSIHKEFNLFMWTLHINRLNMCQETFS